MGSKAPYRTNSTQLFGKFEQLKSIQCTALVHSSEAMHKKQENLCKEWASVKNEISQIVNLFGEKVLNPEPLLTPRKVNHYRYL